MRTIAAGRVHSSAVLQTEEEGARFGPVRCESGVGDEVALWRGGVRTTGVGHMNKRVLVSGGATVVAVVVGAAPVPQRSVLRVADAEADDVAVTASTVTIDCVLYVALTVAVHRDGAYCATLEVVGRGRQALRIARTCAEPYLAGQSIDSAVGVTRWVDHVARLAATGFQDGAIEPLVSAAPVAADVGLEVDAVHHRSGRHCAVEVVAVPCVAIHVRVEAAVAAVYLVVTGTTAGVNEVGVVVGVVVVGVSRPSVWLVAVVEGPAGALSAFVQGRVDEDGVGTIVLIEQP